MALDTKEPEKTTIPKTGAEVGGFYSKNKDDKATSKKATSAEVKQLEESFDGPTAEYPDNHPSKNEQSSLDSKAQEKKPRKKFSGRTKGIVTVLSGSLLGIVAAIFMGAPGLKIIHISQILGNAERSTVSTLRIRKGQMLRYAATGDPGELRVSRIGSRIFGNATAQLDRIGVRFEGRDGQSRPTTLRVDPSRHPDFRGLTDSQRASAIARHYGVNPGLISERGGVYRIDMRGMGTGPIRALTDTTLRPLQNGRIMNGMTKRTFAKFFNTPNMFRPLQRTRAAASTELETRAARRSHEVDRRQTYKPRLSPKYRRAVNTIQSRADASSLRNRLVGLVMITSATCLIHDLRNAIPLANYELLVGPSIAEVTDVQAVASRIESGDNTDPQEVGAKHESFIYDADATIADIEENDGDLAEEEKEMYESWDGKSITGGEAFNALATGRAGEGEPILPDNKQAFEITSTAGAFTEGSLFRRTLCNRYVQGAIGLAMVGGTIATSGVGLKLRLMAAAKAGGQVVKGVGASLLINRIAIGYMTRNLVTIFSGPQGGNLLAYGARAANNLNATTMGGVRLSTAQSNRLIGYEIEEEQRLFAQRGFLDRTFNPTDYRSLTATIMRGNGRPLQDNIVNNIANLANPIQQVSSSFSNINKKVFADLEPYDWGDFPIFGIPPELLEDERFENPFQNEREIVQLLNGKKDAIELLELNAAGEVEPELTEEEIEILQGLIVYVNGLESRARTCWGIDVLYRPTDGWTAIREEHINPVEEEYQRLYELNLQCERLASPGWDEVGTVNVRNVSARASNDDWVRLMLFTLDSSISTGLDCYEGSAQSCRDLAINTGSSQSDIPLGGMGMAGEPNGPSIDTPCPPGAKDLGTDTPAWSDGIQIPTRLCEIEEWVDEGGSSGLVPGAGNGVVVNANVAGAWLALYRAAEADGITLRATSSFRTYERQEELCGPQGRRGCAPPGYSNHQTGHAIDFSSIYSHVNGRVGASGSCQAARGNMEWEWLVANASRFGFGQLPIEAWHWDADYDGWCG